MNPTAPPVAALRRRLAAITALLLDDAPTPDDAGSLLAALVGRVDDDPARVWLLLCAISGALPTIEEVQEAIRILRLERGARAEIGLLDFAAAVGVRGDPFADIQVVTGAVVVDVDLAVRLDTWSGIQRVVRETVPRWARDHEVVPLAWTDGYAALRTIHGREAAKLFGPAHDQTVADGTTALVVPWHCTVLQAEVPAMAALPPLVALARYSGNRIALVGHDMIPVVSADLRPPTEANHFARFLEVAKYADVIAGVSRSARAEFGGFAAGLASQGLPGPTVVEVLEPTEIPSRTPAVGAHPLDRPRVLCVGTHDPHKNHATLVHAARRLWREGVDFELAFVGGRGWRDTTDGVCFEPARSEGWPVRDLGRVTDAELATAYRAATVSVFISLQEGFGLPAAESLACGTPVLCSNFGSLAEIAEGGGCLTVDPRDDDAVTDALRRLLTEPALVTDLRAQIARRPVRTWDDYAAELWNALVPGLS